MIRIPASGDSLCDPPMGKWKNLANQYAASPDQSSPDELKKKWRKSFLSLAQKFTEKLGFKPPDTDQAAPLVVSGHQPYFLHHGVLYKYALLDKAAQKGMTCVFISVDTDPCDGFPVKIPAFKDGYKLAEYRILGIPPSGQNVFYADAVTDIEAFDNFKYAALADLGTLPENFFDYGKTFLQNINAAALPDNMRDAMITLRREYMKNAPGKVLEVPLSAVCETEEFFEFAFTLILRAKEIAESFNRALDAYRTEHKLRSKANPFPDLEIAGSSCETLLWKIKDGKRDALFVKPEGKMENGNAILMPEGVNVNSAEELAEHCRKLGYRLWPRAVSLSLMLRLYLSDLFVHGIGGTKYDRLTDAVIKDVFQIDPPAFVTASRTLAAPHGLDDPSDKLAALKRELREIDFHPERFLEDGSEMQKIAEKKTRLIETIKAPDADKKSIGQKISALNDMLNKSLAPQREKFMEEISAVEKETTRFNAFTNRELPYFLYPPGSS